MSTKWRKYIIMETCMFLCSLVKNIQESPQNMRVSMYFLHLVLTFYPRRAIFSEVQLTGKEPERSFQNTIRVPFVAPMRQPRQVYLAVQPFLFA